MRNEEWKPIVGYEGLYDISNIGNVRSMHNRVGGAESEAIVLKKPSQLYQCVNLCKDKKRKRFFVHRLVAQAFIPNPENKREVNHINGNKFDNALDNLEWNTRKENSHHSFRIGLQVISKGKDNKMCRPLLRFTKDGLFVSEHYSGIEANKATGVSKRQIHKSAYLHLEISGNYKWVYKDEAEEYYHNKKQQQLHQIRLNES